MKPKKCRIAAALLAGIIMLAACATAAPAANPDEVSLSTAIREAAARMENRLERGTRIALINFTSTSQAFSEYVLDELSSILVNSGHLVVVDRANLDRIRQELGFNMSGEVSDASAQEIGQMLGAQAVVTGSLVSFGDPHNGIRRVMLKTIITETAAVVVQHNADIANDRRVEVLLASGGGSGAVNYGTPMAIAQAAAGSTTPATPAASLQAGAQNGTYTYYPRLRPMRAGLVADNIYIPQFTVTRDFIVVHFARTATLAWADGDWDSGISGFYYPQHFSIQDLDNPARSYSPVSAQSTSNGMGRIWTVSFNRFPATRFKLTMIQYSGESPPFVFEEIILGEPD